MKNAYSEELLKTCALYNFNIGCYDWNVDNPRRAEPLVSVCARTWSSYYHALFHTTRTCTLCVIIKGRVNVRLTAMFVCLLSWRKRPSGEMLKGVRKADCINVK
jgi:hypothetical protein